MFGNRLEEADHTDQGRQRFFTRVMPVFALMLGITGLVTGSLIEFGYAEQIAQYGFLAILGLLFVQVGVYIGAEIFRDMWPFNMAFAVIFAGFEGIIITPIIATYLNAGYGMVIMQSLVLTSVIFITFTAIPLVTKRDFSFLGNFLFIMLLGIIAVSLFELFVGFPTFISLIISVITILVFTLFILYDMTKILQEDYGAVGGAITLYLDFIIIFLNLLEILAMAQD